MHFMQPDRQNGNLVDIYQRLENHFGDLHWWPADDPFEVMVGAILTQNTAWTNVEKALDALKESGPLTAHAVLNMRDEQLAALIRPSGYYHLKTSRLKAYCRFFVAHYDGDVATMRRENPSVLRKKLLNVWGIGMETADSILLYACEMPAFVVDAYTRRIFSRHGFIPEKFSYSEIQGFFTDKLPADVPFFKQYHALIVHTGKDFCRKTPLCGECPLRDCLPSSAEEMVRSISQ